MKHIALSFVLSLAIVFGVSAQVSVVKNGKTQSRIVLAHGDQHTAQAANLLQDFVNRISGVSLPITKEAGKIKKGDIIIGGATNEATEDGFTLKTENGCLYVLSGGDKGAIYGVVTILEDYFGVKYYAKDYYTIQGGGAINGQPVANLDIPAINRSETPAFRYRQTHSYGLEDPIYALWCRLEEPKDEFIDNLWVHTFNRILPSKRFGKEHPEYYSFLNGEHRPGDHSQWCLSNPAVFDACCVQLDSIFAANPDLHMISVSQNDGNDTYCHCDECMKIYEEEGAVSGAYIRFMNKLAERYPDKQISTLAYLFTCEPPKKVKPLPNVNIMLCDIDCKREVPLTDNESGRWFVNAMEGWSAISNNIFVWDYGINFDNIVSPFPNFHVLQPNMQLFHKNHTTMHFMQVNGIRGGDFSEMRAYILAKLMWNPYQDVDTLMREFMEGYYGAAAKYMYQYQKLLQGALLASHTDLWIYDSPISHKNGMLCQQLIKTYDELFDQAEAAVANNETLLEHVRVSRLPLQYSKLEIARTLPRTGVDAQPVDVADLEAQLNLFDQRTAQYGVKTINERNNPPAEYCALYRNRFMPQAVQSKALGAKVIWLDVPGKKAKGAADVTPAGAPDPSYQGIAVQGLTDGLVGGTTFVESWIGWKGRDADFIIDLGENKEFTKIETDFLHQLGQWILQPKGGTYQVAADNGGEASTLKENDWKAFGSYEFPEDRDNKVKFVSGTAEVAQPVTARYIKVHVDTQGLCPDWHPGIGFPAWFFMDEINVY